MFSDLGGTSEIFQGKSASAPNTLILDPGICILKKSPGDFEEGIWGHTEQHCSWFSVSTHLILMQMLAAHFW